MSPQPKSRPQGIQKDDRGAECHRCEPHLELVESGLLLLLALRSPDCLSARELAPALGYRGLDADVVLNRLATRGLVESMFTGVYATYTLTDRGRHWLEEGGFLRWVKAKDLMRMAATIA